MAKEYYVVYTADDKDAGMSAVELVDNLRDAVEVRHMDLSNYDIRVIAGWGGKLKSFRLVRKAEA